MSWILLLMGHGLLAFALLGMVTHQVVGLYGGRRGDGLAVSYLAVRSALFTNAVVWLFLANFLVGCVLYTRYRYTSRIVLEDLGALPVVGLFEFKEHVAAIALFTLPCYWLFWRTAALQSRAEIRTALTFFVTASVWLAFLVGHVVNNVRGL